MNTIHFSKKGFWQRSSVSTSINTSDNEREREKERRCPPIYSSHPPSPPQFLLDLLFIHPHLKFKTKKKHGKKAAFFLVSGKAVQVFTKKFCFLGGRGGPPGGHQRDTNPSGLFSSLDRGDATSSQFQGDVLQVPTRGLVMCFSYRPGGSSSAPLQLFSSSLSSGLMAGL